MHNNQLITKHFLINSLDINRVDKAPVNQKTASKILFTTTLISIVTIPLLKILIDAFK